MPSFLEVPDSWMQAAIAADKDYEDQEAKKPIREQWEPGPGVRRAETLYGNDTGKLFFILGNGPSIKKAVKYLAGIDHPWVRVLSLNAAIQKVPSDYWFFLDVMSYFVSRDCENANDTVKLGADRFWRHYKPDVYVFRRAHTIEDVQKGRIVNHATSLIGAMHMACWLGAVRIVTVGCENRVSDHENRTEWKLGALDVGKEKYLNIQRFTYQRIAESLQMYRRVWCPSWCTLADASGGELPLPKTTINVELEKLPMYAKYHEGKEAVNGNAR